jgi:dephospho-CoA kinase
MAPPSFKRIGLTGGIGSGKSTLGKLLQDRGFPLIDADDLSHALTAPQGAAIEPIRQYFGSDFITPEGALDRPRMRQLVFTQAQAKRALQTLLHPLILAGIQSAEASIKDKGNSLVVIDIPLLVESAHWRAVLQQVIVVDCEEETQVARVMQRNKLSAAEVRQIMANQVSRERRLAAADMVVFNNSDQLADLHQQAQTMCLQN